MKPTKEQVIEAINKLYEEPEAKKPLFVEGERVLLDGRKEATVVHFNGYLYAYPYLVKDDNGLKHLVLEYELSKLQPKPSPQFKADKRERVWDTKRRIAGTVIDYFPADNTYEIETNDYSYHTFDSDLIPLNECTDPKRWTKEINGVLARAYERKVGEHIHIMYCYKDGRTNSLVLPRRFVEEVLGLDIMPYELSNGNYDYPVIATLKV